MRILSLRFVCLVLLVGCSHRTPGPTAYFERCFHAETGGLSIPFTGTEANHTFRADCAPDVLYSWQHEYKINWEAFPTNPLTKGIYLYTWRTPLSTYGFGDVQVRLKLQPDVVFKWWPRHRRTQVLCPAIPEPKTIYVITRTYGEEESKNLTTSEYLLCSKDVLHSWSVLTYGAYLEAQNELDFVSRRKNVVPQPYDSFGFGHGRTKERTYAKAYHFDSYYLGWDMGQTRWGDDILRLTMKELRNPEHRQARKIFYNDGVRPDPEAHFSTSVESYFRLTPNQFVEAIRDRSRSVD